jgi:predicted RNase H-like nuclease (RuvC/YqgF family)
MKAKECKLQFGKVYEIALNYTNSLKHKIIESHTTSEVMKNILTQRINDKVEDKMSIKRESKIEVLYNKQISDINELKQIIKSKNEENNKLNDMIDNLQKIIKSKDELLSKRKAYQRKIDKYLIVDYASIKYILKLDTIISYKLKKFYGKYCQLGQ